MTTVIIEDETAALANLEYMIGKVCPQCNIVATLESVVETVEWFDDNMMPDIVFMDIHLADGDAFRIFDRVDITAPIIFTTAYDRYALDAFKVNSIDYLLKPIKATDLQRAIDKFDRLTRAEKKKYSRTVTEMASRHSAPISSILIHQRDKLIPLKPEMIAFGYTSGEKVTLRTTDGQSLPYDRSLDALSALFSPTDFFRANRQYVIARTSIKDISVWFGNRLAVNLACDVPERIIISKARVPLFKKWLRGEIPE